MADLTVEQRKNIAASLRSAADMLDPAVEPAPEPTPTPTPPPTSTPASGIPPLADRFELVKLMTFDCSSLPSDFYAYAHSKGNEGIGLS
jgi:hypothetical protein